jgi:hypothetical protein
MAMTNERFENVHSADGATVHVRFDLTDEQLLALANAVNAVKAERFMGAEMTAQDVLDMRELIAVADGAAERAADGFYGGTLVMTVTRLGMTLAALTERLTRMDELGFTSRQDELDRPELEAIIDDLYDLHVRALVAALETEPVSHPEPEATGAWAPVPEGCGPHHRTP